MNVALYGDRRPKIVLSQLEFFEESGRDRFRGEAFKTKPNTADVQRALLYLICVPKIYECTEKQFFFSRGTEKQF